MPTEREDEAGPKLHPGVYDTNPETASEFPHGPVIYVPKRGSIFFDLYMEPEAEKVMAALSPAPTGAGEAEKQLADRLVYGMDVTAEELIHAFYDAKKLREAAKGQLVVVNAANARAEAAEARVAELKNLVKRVVDQADDLARSVGLERIQEAEGSLLADCRAALSTGAGEGKHG
jgi:hypothetical protein